MLSYPILRTIPALDENLPGETLPSSMPTPAASPPPQIDDDKTLSLTG